ncbi:MAG TPA: hypothetical protein H9898_02780 [Candidatus Anaerobiospirillum stercoravium]|nr:hypothetical protein [Candidatus Anaerobiospirillum stercoravium]
MYPFNRDQIITGLNNLNDTLVKLLAGRGNEEQTDPKMLEFRVKALKQVLMQVDNSLGELHDMLDTLEYHKDERYEEAAAVVRALEDNTAQVVEYLRSLGKY